MTLYYDFDFIKENNLATILDHDPFYSNISNRGKVILLRPSDGMECIALENFGWNPAPAYKEVLLPTMIAKSTDIVDNWEACGLLRVKDRRGFPLIAKMIKLLDVRKFLLEHQLPLPTALFPGDVNNTIDVHFQPISASCGHDDKCISLVEDKKRKSLLLCELFYNTEAVHREDYREYEILEPISSPETIARNRFEALENIYNIKEMMSKLGHLEQLSVINDWIDNYLESMPSYFTWERVVKKKDYEKTIKNWEPLTPTSIAEATEREKTLSKAKEGLRCINEGLPLPTDSDNQGLPPDITTIRERFYEITSGIIACLDLIPTRQTERFPIIIRKERLMTSLEEFHHIGNQICKAMRTATGEDKRHSLDLLTWILLFNHYICNENSLDQIRHLIGHDRTAVDNTGILNGYDIATEFRDYCDIYVGESGGEGEIEYTLEHCKADANFKESKYANILGDAVVEGYYSIEKFREAALRFIDWRSGVISSLDREVEKNATAEDSSTPVTVAQEVAGVMMQGEPELPWWQEKSVEEILDKLREQGIREDPALARGLQSCGVTLPEIGRVLRPDGHFDSEDANKKRAQRLLGK